MRWLRRAALLFFQFSLVWTLLLAPFAHAINLAAATDAAAAELPACHQDVTPATDEPAAAEECCCLGSGTCHCVVSLALPRAGTSLPALPAIKPLPTPLHGVARSLPPPEPPPPRAA